MHRYTAAVLALSLVVAGVGVATGPAAAQSGDDGVLDTLTGDADGPIEAAVNAGDFLYGMAVGASLTLALVGSGLVWLSGLQPAATR